MTETNEYVHTGSLLPGLISTTVGYRSTGAVQGVHRGLPSPTLTFIFSLQDPIVTAVAPEQLDTPAAGRTAIITSGLHTRPAFIQQPTTQAGIQMAVHPLAARALFGASTAELGFPVDDGEDVLGVEAERLRARMIQTPLWTERFRLLQDYLRRRVDDADVAAGVRAEIVAAWIWLARHRGNGSIDGLARHVLLSRRQLHTLFTRELGIGPKAVNRLMRFQHAVRAISAAVRSGTTVDLGRVAADCGYFDQSHLTRDFRQFTGTSPTGWLAEERRNIQAGSHRSVDD